MSTGFLEIQLDPRINYGTKGGLAYTSVVVTNPSRIETRFPQQSKGYWKLNISFTKTKANMSTIHHLYIQAQGKVYGWRLRNFREYYTCTDNYLSTTKVATPEPITTFSGGTTMQLIHTRNPSATNIEIVPIKKPDMNSMGGTTGNGTTAFYLYRDGSSTPYPSAGNWSLDVTTGIVTFNSSQTGHSFSWAGYWDTPVRFDTDESDISWEDYDKFTWEDIALMEIQVLD